MLEVLKDKVVGIAGCGGLGSNCAVALCRIGIGKLVLVDYDVVEKSNLNRQYYFRDQLGYQKVFALGDNLYWVNEDVELEMHNVKLTIENAHEVFSHCDIVVEAVDEAKEKKMLIESIHGIYPEKPIVSGVGMAGWGDNNSIKTLQFDNLYICGDWTKEISAMMPPLAPRVGIVAHMQANQVLEILLNTEEDEYHIEQ